jgi:putative ABC transport system permease protein
MIKSYLLTSYRNLMRNKGFSAINIFGLTVGLTSFLLILFYVYDELNYDRFNESRARIYRINEDVKYAGNTALDALTPAPLAEALKHNFPEIQEVVRFRATGGIKIKKNFETISEKNAAYADPSIFDVFTLPLISGNSRNALDEPNSIVVSESAAKKYFNSTDVVGKQLTLGDGSNYRITAVMKDIPQNSHFIFDFILSMASSKDSKSDIWLNSNFNTYLLLRHGATIIGLKRKFPAFIETYLAPQVQKYFSTNFSDFKKTGNYFNLVTTPLMDIHLHSNLVGELGRNGNIEYVYIFSAISIFILLIACINFMNLSTARSQQRAREVGVRKVLGSDRRQLMFQFLTESLIISVISTTLALIIALTLLPVFNNLAGKKLSLSFIEIFGFLPVLVAIIVVIGLLAGIYPAFYLSAFKPATVLKGKFFSTNKNSWFRSGLVIGQFTISIGLIAGTLIIFNQLNYIQTKDMGYNRSHVLIVKNVQTLGNQALSFKEEVKTIPGVTGATLTGFLPVNSLRNNSALFQDAGLDQKNAIFLEMWNVDEDYIPTLKMQFVKGRNFQKDMLTDSTGIILNETAASLLKSRKILGKPLYYITDLRTSQVTTFHVLGIVKDFHFSSLHEAIQPLSLLLSGNVQDLTVSFAGTNIKNLVAQLEVQWKTFAPRQHFDYSFMDEDFNALYLNDQRTGELFIIFTMITISIACLGLIGLATYRVQQRTKEIGIRKVLGANISSIIHLLSKDFMKLVIIAILLATPASWFLMHQWLQDFAYRISIHSWVFLVAGGSALVLTFIMICIRSIKAALVNPVRSLRAE